MTRRVPKPQAAPDAAATDLSPTDVEKVTALVKKVNQLPEPVQRQAQRILERYSDITERAIEPRMGIEFTQLTGVLRTIPVNYLGQVLNITFKADEFSPKKSKERARLRREEEEGKHFTEDERNERTAELNAILMAQVIVKWDMLHKGEPMPLTEESMEMLPYSLLAHIVTAMNEDTSPKPLNTRR